MDEESIDRSHASSPSSATMCGALPRGPGVALPKRSVWLNNATSFHHSFDDRLQLPNGTKFSNSCGEIDRKPSSTAFPVPYSLPKRRAAFSCASTSRGAANIVSTSSVHMPLSCGTCAAAGGHALPTGACAACAMLARPPQLGGRSPQSSFESNGDVGQISMNWMRMTGAIAPSKILNSDYGSATSTPTTGAPALGSAAMAGGGGAAPPPAKTDSRDSRDSTSGAVVQLVSSNPHSVSSFAGLAASTQQCGGADALRRRDSAAVSHTHLAHSHSHKIMPTTPLCQLSAPLRAVTPSTATTAATAATASYGASPPPMLSAATVAGGTSSSTALALVPTSCGHAANSTLPSSLETASMGRSSLSALNMTVTVDADRSSKRSLSLKSISELELQRVHDDESRVPLMNNTVREEKFHAERAGGGRLIRRQYLFHVRRVTSDFALLFSLMGIALMVVENELGVAHYYELGNVPRVTLRSLIFFSTIVLVVLVIKFHVHEIQLYMNANSVADWWIAMTPQLCFQLALEVFVCSICPLPIDVGFSWTTVYEDGRPELVTRVPVDVLLSIPMFLRLYWVWRVMLQHSRLFTDNCNRSIAGLNRVNLNSRFILKILMTLCPGTMLMVFTASLWIIAGWVLRLCERHYDGDPINAHSIKHQNYLNSLWLIAITFLSVGYGDIVPNTYCGRLTAVIVGILGTGTSSMVVAVIARKLELTRAEKHVHNFMMDSQLTKQLKHSAANVLRETWFIYKYRILATKVDKEKVRYHQRKFLVAIYELRKVKRDQRKLNENSVSLGDVAKTTSNSYEVVRDIHAIQEGLALRVTSVEHQLSDIQRELTDVASLLRAVLRQREDNNRDDDGGGEQEDTGGGEANASRHHHAFESSAGGSLRRRNNNYGSGVANKKDKEKRQQ